MWRRWLWLSGVLVSLSVAGLAVVNARPLAQPVSPMRAEAVPLFDDQVILDLSTSDYVLSPVDLSIGHILRKSAIRNCR
jgi:hypothetical protein